MIRLVLFLVAMVFCLPVQAMEMKDFASIPIAHEGRIKPLDSFARATLKNLSGRENIEDQNAVEILATALFNPASGIEKKIFKIEDENLRHRLGLTERKVVLYSLEEISPGLKNTTSAVAALLRSGKKDFGKDDRALLDIHEKALSYMALLRSLSLLLPLNIELPEKYKLARDEAISFLNLKKLEQDLSADLRIIIRKKGENFDSYNEDEKNIAVAAYQLEIMAAGGSGNDVLKIIPPQWESDHGDWHAPWEILQSGEGSPRSAKLLDAWREMGQAYNEKDNSNWQRATATARELALAQAGNIAPWRFQLEILQNEFPPVLISLILYALSFAATLGFVIFEKRVLRFTAFSMLSIGAIIHSFGLAARILILDRPPVGTLYESLIFVALMSVLIALFIEKSLKNNTGLLLGSIAGTALGLVSLTFAGEGDTMEMLTAVLNTNFWLATHVLCITLGYGWCILTAILAHLALFSRKYNFSNYNGEKSIFALHTLAILSLLFTAIGTILGGIWADQSWGRFWGWDPKENGALLIVLWLVWALHAKLGGQFKERGFLASMAFLNVIVAISWIGVNLLGVGLHSYGFTDGMFYGFAGFIAFETALIGFLSMKRHD